MLIKSEKFHMGSGELHHHHHHHHHHQALKQLTGGGVRGAHLFAQHQTAMQSDMHHISCARGLSVLCSAIRGWL